MFLIGLVNLSVLLLILFKIFSILVLVGGIKLLVSAPVDNINCAFCGGLE
jgi:hypothetical protein